MSEVQKLNCFYYQ